MMARLLPRLALLLAAVALVPWLPRPAHAQGLREAALELLDQLADAAPGQSCSQAGAAQALLDEIARAEATSFMADETARLEQAATAARTACDELTARTPAEPERLAALHARCLSLGQSRAYCAVRAECAEVSQQSPRMAAFWQAARAVPCP